jgi:hypothetical protein
MLEILAIDHYEYLRHSQMPHNACVDMGNLTLNVEFGKIQTHWTMPTTRFVQTAVIDLKYKMPTFSGKQQLRFTILALNHVLVVQSPNSLIQSVHNFLIIYTYGLNIQIEPK